jgi:hypothetical protein
MRDGTRCRGTFERVGADFVDLVESGDEGVRRTERRGEVRTVSLDAMAVVRIV